MVPNSYADFDPAKQDVRKLPNMIMVLIKW